MKKSLASHPRPPLLVAVAGLVLLVPTMLLLVLSVVGFLYLLIVPEPTTEGQFTMLFCLGTMSVPSSWMGWALFRAFCRREEKVARALSVVCVFLTLLSVPGWIAGVLDLSGVRHDIHDWESWWELAIYSLVFLTIAFAGFEMWRWQQILSTAKPIRMVDDLSGEF